MGSVLKAKSKVGRGSVANGVSVETRHFPEYIACRVFRPSDSEFWSAAINIFYPIGLLFILFFFKAANFLRNRLNDSSMVSGVNRAAMNLKAKGKFSISE